MRHDDDEATPLRLVESAPPDQGQMWRVADVARFLQMSTSFVYKEAEAGRLPCTRFGAALRFFPEEVLQFARKSRR